LRLRESSANCSREIAFIPLVYRQSGQAWKSSTSFAILVAIRSHRIRYTPTFGRAEPLTVT
jgi:hypothetical protein